MSTRMTTWTKATGVARSLMVKLKYYQQPVTFTGAAGAQAQTAFSGNSLYDPYTSGVGTQPYYYDQYTNLYDKWCVTGSKITVIFANGSSSMLQEIGVQPSQLSGNLSSDWPILPLQRFKMLNVKGADNGIRSITAYCSTAKAYGISKKRVLDDPNFSGATGANPASQWYWLVSAQDFSKASAVSIVLSVIITYYVKFFDTAEAAVS